MAIVSASKGTNRDRDFKSFIESPARGVDYTAREVFVSNTSNDPIPVEFAIKGEIKSDYTEISSTGLGSTTIINKTIGVGLGAGLIEVICSGDNRSIFTIEINSSVMAKQRIYFTKYNLNFKMNSLPLVEGDNIKIIVENKTNVAANFNATLIYNEFTV